MRGDFREVLTQRVIEYLPIALLYRRSVRFCDRVQSPVCSKMHRAPSSQK